MSTPIPTSPSPKYSLWDYSKGNMPSWVLMWTHDFNGKPLMSLEQAEEMRKRIGSDTMRIEEIN